MTPYIVLMALLLAFLSSGILIGGWVVYPAVISRRGMKVAESPPGRAAESRPAAELPPITVIVATREAPARVRARVDNLRDSDYPAELLHIIVAVDHAAQDVIGEMTDALADFATVVAGDAPGGKASALNAGVRSATTDILVFADTAQHFAPGTIRALVSELETGPFEAVTGTLAAESGDALMDAYWKRELNMRMGQAAKHSIICVTGCVYAMKRENWNPIPTGTICDDLWVTWSHALNGKRVGIVRSATAVDPRRFTRDQEYSRRLRTTTGLIQFIGRMPRVMSPTGNPMITDFLLHKVIRLVTPLLALIAVAAAFAVVVKHRPVLIASVVCAALLALAAAARYRFNFPRLAGDVGYAARLLFMPLSALRYALRGDWNVWRHSAAAASQPPRGDTGSTS